MNARDNNNISIDQSNTINNTTHIHVNPFGQEDIGHLLLDAEGFAQRLLRCINDGVKGLIDMMANIHFDSAHPENHTLRKRDGRGRFVEVFDGTEWCLDFGEKVADKVFGKIEPMLADFVSANLQVPLCEIREQIARRRCDDEHTRWVELQHVPDFILTPEELRLKKLAPAPSPPAGPAETESDMFARINADRALERRMLDDFLRDVAEPLGWDFPESRSVNGRDEDENKKRVAKARSLIYDFFLKAVHLHSARIFLAKP